MRTTKETNERRSDEVQLPNSRRIYVEGPIDNIRVPFREVALNPTRQMDETLEENPPVLIYDTSGPWGDPAARCNEREGCLLYTSPSPRD